ncbi:CMP-sialic acid transporter 5-like isoform X2 [Selaginella moellendorffii]|uniref:CMP-sialic acid transporter 5-like n=1 Tax=Selaginella moellendorffii TaxID=88036 RepID=UPI000D1C3DAF|nr:CMP-sialic acid transporter 5-like [Selaginella moellendorffii]XP_024538942.1 CMP-sialic acid transporter 5-like isoform X2 [Selaginella moellendorffii]|eukprot:XP_024531637.1 CMP-sialic acid transporter 5-like [Selaginella moellendorffii]
MMTKNGMLECHRCGGKLGNASPTVRSISKAYDRHHSDQASRFRGLSILLVAFDCMLIALQPILVYMSKVDGKFLFSPISVNFLTEMTKVVFAICMLVFQARKQRAGERSLLSPRVIFQAARANRLLALPAALYAVNNYLKFAMQLYFNPATVKMLSNLKVLMIALLLKVIMRRRFSVLQWEALALLLIGISVNQLHTTPTGTTVVVPLQSIAYVYTLIFVTVPSMASVFNEYALKSQFETSVHLQNLFLYSYGAMFNFLAILVTADFSAGNGLNLFKGHSRATMFLIFNNAAQGILSCFFLKYADAILKKYSSTVATIFTALASAALFGHKLTINFVLGVSIVIISMHQFFSALSKTKDEKLDNQMDTFVDKHNTYTRPKDDAFINMTAGAGEQANLKVGILDDRQPLLPT